MHKRNFDRSKFKVTCDISPTIYGWLLVIYCHLIFVSLKIEIIKSAKFNENLKTGLDILQKL